MVHQIELRTATLDDVAALHALLWRSVLVWDEDRANLLANPDAVEVPRHLIEMGHVRIAISEGAPVGFSALLMVDADLAEVNDLFVEPSRMRTGVGRRLVDDLVSQARMLGAMRLEVTANPQAVGFYERVGFIADHEVPTRFRPGMRMHRALTRPTGVTA